jgi:hypothetical protein
MTTNDLTWFTSFTLNLEEDLKQSGQILFPKNVAEVVINRFKEMIESENKGEKTDGTSNERKINP